MAAINVMSLIKTALHSFPKKECMFTLRMEKFL